ncbi:MAG: cysteine desulfurase family protein [Flavobacteriales bacterium]|nr:cysteine desulfurase family protein [Flavobacteriales bacterium]
MEVYLDNAATTPIAKEVIKEIEPYLHTYFGNPSSTHSFGRKTKNAIEINRRKIANFINADTNEIVFTSGGTEADNMAMRCAVLDLGVKRIITSKIEHHAVGHTAECLKKSHHTEIIYLTTDEFGNPSIDELKEYLKKDVKTLVSLMHANNEIGTLLPIEEVSSICHEHQHVYFHSDTVQTMGHYKFDVKNLKIDFLVCSAHKFHGPKGIGFLYVNKNLHLNPIITGGSQERSHRGGTENLYGIIGLGKAMELAFTDLEDHQEHVQNLKTHLIEQLIKIDSRIKFNGELNIQKSLYTVLSVRFPKDICNSMLLFSLDIHGIATSGGSACSSGSTKGSHVLAELPDQDDYQSVRFSFSRYNTKKEVEFTLDKISSIVANKK